MLTRKLALITLLSLLLIISNNFFVRAINGSAEKREPISPIAPVALDMQLSDPVMTAAGPVRGELSGNTAIFRGIPYAQPPVGDLRWKAPLPASAHSDVLDAVNFGSPCAQPGSDGVDGSEDCLSLNIWAPNSKTAALLPVMFFIHGGGNIFGASSNTEAGALLYDGLALEQKGVVVVTINYRLGPLGFLAHPLLTAEDTEHHSSGNYGMLDQILALQWVKDNISNFNGDPNNVTIFGESAGGRNVMALIDSPLATNLFHKAIIESGAPLFVDMPLQSSDPSVQSAESIGLSLSSKLGCENGGDTLACLRASSPADLLTAIPPDELGLNGIQYGQNVDGYALTASTVEALQKAQQNNVPLMIGTNKDEFLGFISLLNVSLDTETDYENALKKYFCDKEPQLLAKYPVSGYGTPTLAVSALVSDFAFRAPVRTAIRLIAPQQPKLFEYQFTHVLSIEPNMGAFHGLELIFVFHSITNIRLFNATKKEVKLADRMVEYWTNFAKKGDPNGKGLPKWPAYTLDGDKNITLDTKIGVNTGLRKDFLDFDMQLFGNNISLSNCNDNQ